MAIKIAKAKTLKINESKVEEINRFLHWLENKLKEPDDDLDKLDAIELFKGSHLWFRNDVAYKMHSLLCEFENYSPDVKNFLEVGLSTLLKGMSNARMDSVTPLLPDDSVYIDYKHYYRKVDNNLREIPVYKRVYSQIRRMKNSLFEFNKETDVNLICEPLLCDARQLSDYIKHCDLVVTSPPYWSAQNYQEIHMLSMALFNLSIMNGMEIGRDENAYLDDMRIVFKQILKILKGHFALVIGHDEYRLTHEKLFQIIIDTGFIHVDTIIRRISNQVSRAKQIKNEYIYIFKI
jgi:hypothetical protein